MNGILWKIYEVAQNDPKLVDRTGSLRVATTDPNYFSVFLSDSLQGDFKIRVLIHELSHCVMISFNLIDQIHKAVRPEYWIEAEEWICNFISDYGFKVFKAAEHIAGDDAIAFARREIERLIV